MELTVVQLISMTEMICDFGISHFCTCDRTTLPKLSTHQAYKAHSVRNRIRPQSQIRFALLATAVYSTTCSISPPPHGRGETTSDHTFRDIIMTRACNGGCTSAQLTNK